MNSFGSEGLRIVIMVELLVVEEKRLDLSGTMEIKASESPPWACPIERLTSGVHEKVPELLILAERKCKHRSFEEAGVIHAKTNGRGLPLLAETSK
jgi:hypothetical protein